MVLAHPALSGKGQRRLRDGRGGIRAGQAVARGGFPIRRRLLHRGPRAHGRGATAQYHSDHERFFLPEQTLRGPAAHPGGRRGGFHGPDFFGGGLSRHVLRQAGGGSRVHGPDRRERRRATPPRLRETRAGRHAVLLANGGRLLHHAVHGAVHGAARQVQHARRHHGAAGWGD